MSALYLDWPNLYVKGQGGDLQVNARGSLAIASGATLAIQKLVRYLLTNDREVQPDGTVLPPDYIYNTQFGAALCREIGDSYADADLQNIKAIILEGLGAIDEIAPIPVPQVQLKRATGGLIVIITYWDAQTNRAVSVPAFTVPQ